MTSESLYGVLSTLNKLRDVDRRIVLADGPENDEEHTCGMCILITLLRPYLQEEWDVDWSRVYALATVHDTPEILTGDVHYLAAQDNKSERELAAVNCMYANFEHMRHLWEEYERRQSKEAILVKQLDILQAVVRIVLSDGMTWRVNKVTQSRELAFSKWIWEQDTVIGGLLCHLFSLAAERRLFWEGEDVYI